MRSRFKSKSQTLPNFISVSYTHLDVYKRQVPTMPNAALALLEPDFLLPINAMRSLLAELDALPC